MSQLLVDHMKKETGKEQIGNWLASIGMVEYAATFHDAGFDDAQFLLSTGLSDSTLDSMRIDKPGHRMKLQSLYQLKESIPELNEEAEEESGEESGGESSGSEEEEDESGDGSDDGEDSSGSED